VIDTSTNSVTATIAVGDGPLGIAVDPEENRAYVANYFDNAVSVIDSGSNAVSTIVIVGGFPSFLAWVPESASEPEDEEEDENDDGCFIATAAYGSEMADDVIVLKHFRDTVLLQSSLGRTFVKWYYAISPPFAEFIEEHETIRTATRCALTPVMYGVRHPKTGALIFLCSIMAILLTLAVRRSTKS
jgi:YVTN family beta-propeller protein